MIKHIVLWKFGPDTKREQQEFFAALRALQGVIAGVGNGIDTDGELQCRECV